MAERIECRVRSIDGVEGDRFLGGDFVRNGPLVDCHAGYKDPEETRSAHVIFFRDLCLCAGMSLEDFDFRFPAVGASRGAELPFVVWLSIVSGSNCLFDFNSFQNPLMRHADAFRKDSLTSTTGF
jgi:hypothetical protein